LAVKQSAFDACVNSNQISGSVFKHVSGTNWVEIRKEPTRDIIAGGSMLCAVDTYSGGDLYQYNGTPGSWTKIGTPGRMFAIDGNGRLYGLTPDGQAVYMYNGKPNSWTKIGGPAGQIFAGGPVLCATSPDNQSLWCFREPPQAG
jgi:hypothetical protein